MSEKQYGMVIDIRSCTGCQTCTIACKTSNEVPGEGRWCHLEDYYGGTLYMPNVDNGKVSLHFRPLLCNHCSDPLCVMNCPTGAMRKDEATGVVSVDQDICIGCSTCANSCSYGAPVLNEERMVMGKCNLCAGRTDNGDLPFCVQACPARIRHWGEITDPDSEVSKMIAEHHAEVYMAENGTNPSVYYILPE